MTKMMDNLLRLRDKGVIEDIDFELCRFLNQQESGISKEVLIAGCLLSYLYRRGDVCLVLDRYAGQPVFDEVRETDNIIAPGKEKWLKELSQSQLVGDPGDFKPLVLDAAGRLYLHKLWHYEKILADHLLKRSKQKTSEIDIKVLKDGLARLFIKEQSEIDWQQVAAVNAVKNKLSIISGGPGTGKTFTVLRIIVLLLEQAKAADKEISIALAAPTGKAAARIKDAVVSGKSGLNISEDIMESVPVESMTLHQLLGARRNTSAFKYNEENPLPFDVVIVDEASMIDQALMSKLMQALLADTRLILLGDKDQLASVEAGAVLGDICNVNENRFSEEVSSWFRELSLEIPDSYITDNPDLLTDNITLLTKSYRFGSQSGIQQLATSINTGDFVSALKVLKSPNFRNVSLIRAESQSKFEEILRKRITNYRLGIKQSNSAEEAMAAYENFRILSAHRRGPWGVDNLNRLIERILQENFLIPRFEQWYPGKPVIINKNDYTLGLHNGDTGVCLADNTGELKVYFRDERSVRSIVPSRLPDHNTAYALTVHKSQGSEFENVFLILPAKPSKILTRELLYTAVTRARTSITIFGQEVVLKEGISKKMQRFSGLRDRLWEK